MTSLLDVSGLGRTFGGLKAVRDLSFSVQSDQILGLIGPNGAGKTTIVNLLSGVIKPSSGRVALSSEDVTGLAPHELARKSLTMFSKEVLPYVKD